MGDDYDGLQTLVDKVVEEAIYCRAEALRVVPRRVRRRRHLLRRRARRRVLHDGRWPGPRLPDRHRRSQRWLHRPDGQRSGRVGQPGAALPVLGGRSSRRSSRRSPASRSPRQLPGARRPGPRGARAALHGRSHGVRHQHVGRRAAPTSTTTGNATLGLANQVAQTLNTWQGAAATSFATYLNLFQQVVGNQALAAEVLRMTLLMEKEMWIRLRSDVVDLRQELRERLPRGTGVHARVTSRRS